MVLNNRHNKNLNKIKCTSIDMSTSILQGRTKIIPPSIITDKMYYYIYFKPLSRTSVKENLSFSRQCCCSLSNTFT